MPSESRTRLDLEAIAAQLQRDGKQRLWSSLDELARTPEYEAALHNEFPSAPAGRQNLSLSRREALKLMAASAALSGLTACTKLPP